MGYGTLLWRHNECDGVSNHQPHDCLLRRLFRRRSKKTSKLRVTGLCAENSPVTGEFPAQRASNAENVFIWRRLMQRALIGRADSRIAPNQREASLQSNAVSHWLDANLESALPAGTGRVIGWSKHRLGNSSPALNSGNNAHVIHGNSRNFSEGSPLCSPNGRQGVCPWGCARRLLKSMVPYFSLRAVSSFIHILLTHWGRAMYICVRKLAIICSENAPSHYFAHYTLIKIVMLIMMLIEHCITSTSNNKPRIN